MAGEILIRRPNLVMTFAVCEPENDHRKFVDFPIKHGGSFHSYVPNSQRVLVLEENVKITHVSTCWRCREAFASVQNAALTIFQQMLGVRARCMEPGKTQLHMKPYVRIPIVG